ncbi:terpene cyclase/mutase family protein, partial [bacterium AH-315-F18]|nr:terpene cyclase/mutase family protein [bacterium AH-315-F18]
RTGEVVRFTNYSTALTLIGLNQCPALNKPRDVRPLLAEFLAQRQLSAAFKFEPLQTDFGAWDYYDDNHPGLMRTDISVTTFVLEGLSYSHTKASARAKRQARMYLRRCQNFSTHPKDAGRQAMDGGFFFTPLRSKAGYHKVENDQVLLRSYGSTTAEGLRALLYTGQSASNLRVKSACAWLAGHYRMDRTPGFPAQSPVPFATGAHYYYLHGVALALREVELRHGEVLPPPLQGWPDDLSRWLVDQQKTDGRWFNAENIMREGHPVLATSFAIRALSAAYAVHCSREKP